MNPKTLGELNGAYDTVRNEFGSRFNAVHDIQTGVDTTPQSTAFEVATRILDAIEDRTE